MQDHQRPEVSAPCRAERGKAFAGVREAGLEDLHQGSGHVDGATAASLRVLVQVLFPEVPAHDDHPADEVDVRPLERANFSEPGGPRRRCSRWRGPALVWRVEIPKRGVVLLEPQANAKAY